MKTIRTFIAIELLQDVKTELGRLSQAVAGLLPVKSVRWVKPEQMHLTLRFLGDTAVSQLPALSTELDRISGQHIPFILQLSELGCFPNPKRPRVIWVGLEGESGKDASGQVARDEQRVMSQVSPIHPLFAMQAAIETAVVQLGWQKEDRPFRAHLTLGRVNEGHKLDGTRWQVAVKPLKMTVSAVYLMESQLWPSGPVYTLKHTSYLNRHLQQTTD